MNIKKFIKQYWLMIIILTQPILDVIAYFTFDKNLTVISFTIRSIYLAFIVIYTFIKSPNKKKYILMQLPFIIFSLMHLINTYRLVGLNIFDDLRYLIMVMQFPVITVSLIDYLKCHSEQYENITKSMAYSYIIIFISVILSLITHSGKTTYENYGLTGWFTSANTQSMILTMLSPIFLYFATKKNNIIYFISLIMFYILLFFNGTRACYYTLVFTLPVIIYILLINRHRHKAKLIMTIILALVSIILYKNSYASVRKQDVKDNAHENKEVADLINKGNLTKQQTIDILKTNGAYIELMDIFGEDKVYEIMKDKMTVYNLTDNRLLKRNYAKILFNESDTFTKIVGLNHGDISYYGMDLENDLTAIYYYYGYLGFAIYILFILYFAYLGIKIIFLKPIKIVSPKYIILSYTIALSIFGSEYSGALLRKTNANIYLSFLFALYYIYLRSSYDNDNIKIKVNKNKISFLLLHLGYGGIETSTINTANALSNKYEVELISFYNLKQNQVSRINPNIKINYLYNGEPNRKEFKDALKRFKIFNILQEGFKAIDILYRKKYLVTKAIINCNSQYLISTRYDFSLLLSKYGNNFNVKIAIEHHYHNNNSKYINILKNKYNNIDYLFALTETLYKDYQLFLKNNHHTKIVLMPNMLLSLPKKTSNLEKKEIITMSRLDYGKKNDDIIKAFAKTNYHDWHLSILGDGPEYENLSNLIKELHLENNVSLEGYIPKEKLEKYLLNSSIFLMASLTEGLPMVLLEAMSYGIPCIAYETASGVNDIIDDSKNGYVIKERNELQYIKKLQHLMDDPVLRKRMSKEAIKKAEKFSKENILKKWYNILK
jgi:hypothetical protein